jgi:hypothetical protein
MSSEPFIYIDDAPSLDNTHPSIIFAASCSNAEGVDNLARSLIGNGAIGIVAATTYGWYTPGWQSPADGNIMSLDYYFYYYLIAQNDKVGDALFSSKMYYFNYLYFPDPWGGDPDWTPQQNMLDYVLFGDPSLVRAGVGVEETGSEKTIQCTFNMYPNPVASQGYIEYVTAGDADVTITLYNAIGQKVKTIFTGSVAAGQHSVPFLRNTLSSGVYFIRMKIEDEDNTSITMRQKIILL